MSLRLTERELMELQARRKRGKAKPPAIPYALYLSPPLFAELVLVLPLPPSTNHAYANRARGGRTLSREGRAYKELVHDYTLRQSRHQGWFYTPGQRLSLSLSLYFASNVRRDLSNTIKLPEDAMAKALGFDDSVVDLLTVERKSVDPANPRCEVVLRYK